MGLGGTPRSAVVCEDDAGIAVALRTVLSAHGVEIAALLDRVAPLADAVREHDPDVVVVDAALLVTRGVDLLVDLRAVTPAALVVLCPPGLELSGFPCATDVLPADDLSGLPAVLARVPQARPAAASGSTSSNAPPV